MTGDKPDPRLRTPMQWNPRPGLGFTSGTPWEAAQRDSFTTTVQAQREDTTSLLNQYRKLMRVRQANEALATGRLVPLVANSPSVAAYLRRAGDHAVLVIANLGTSAVRAVSLSAASGVLPPGHYEPSNLLGGPDAIVLEVSADRSLRDYRPLTRPLRPGESLVLDLIRR